MFYVRWAKGEPRRARVFDALAGDHPAFGLDCLYCGHPLGGSFVVATGEPEKVQLIAVGLIEPDEKEQAKFDGGGWVSAGACLIHERCGNQMDDEQLEVFVAELVAAPATEADAVDEVDD